MQVIEVATGADPGQPRGVGNLGGCCRLVGVAKDMDDQLVGGE
jgi:hypothetical protein